ncbi:MAG: alpha/beta hydrolase [bacterium]|nr:alpha/beta hydrolase [bacterium]
MDTVRRLTVEAGERLGARDFMLSVSAGTAVTGGSKPMGRVHCWGINETGKTHPIVLMHQNSGSKVTMEPFIAALKQELGDEQPIYAFDFPGHGASDDVPDDSLCNASINGFSQVATDVLKQLNLENATLIGFSLGGNVAQNMMDRKRVGRVISSGAPTVKISPTGLVNGFFPDSVTLPTGQTITREEALHQLTTSELASPEARRRFFTQLFPMFFHPDGKSAAKDGVLTAYFGPTGSARDTLISCVERTQPSVRTGITNLVAYYKAEARNTVGLVTQPQRRDEERKLFLSIDGEKCPFGRTTTRKTFIENCDALSHVRHVVIKGGRHGALVTHAKESARVIKEWLEPHMPATKL